MNGETGLRTFKEGDSINLAEFGFDGITREQLDEFESRLANEKGFLEGLFGADDTDIPFLGAANEAEDLLRDQQQRLQLRTGQLDAEGQAEFLGRQIEGERPSGRLLGLPTGDIGTAARKSLVIGAEMLASGGAGAGLAKIGGRGATAVAMSRYAGQIVGAPIAREAIGQVVGDGGAATVNVMRRALPELELSDAEAQRLASLADEDFADHFLPLLREQRGLASGFAEDVVQSAVESVGGQALGRLPAVASLRSMHLKTMRKAITAAGAKNVDDAATALLDRAAYAGFLNEVGEEFAQGVITEGIFGENALDGLPQDFDELATIVAVSAMPGGAAALWRKAHAGRRAKAQQAVAADESTAESETAEQETSTGGEPILPGEATDGSPGVDPGIFPPGDGEAPATEGVAAEPEGQLRGPAVASAGAPLEGDAFAEPDVATAPRQYAPTAASPDADPIGRNLFGSFVPVQEVTEGRQVDAPQVVNAIGGILQAAGGTPVIRQGRAANVPSGARGAFWIREGVIDVRRVNDITTSSHEVAHHLERVVYGQHEPWIDGGAAAINATQRRELFQLGKELYGDTEPNGGYLREGWAEFMAYYVTQDGTSKAPEMMAWMRDVFLPQNPRIADAIRKAQDHARVWRFQGAHNRASQSVVSTPSRLGRAAQAVASIGTRQFWQRHVADAFVEELGPLRRASRYATDIGGAKLRAVEDPYKLGKAFRMSAPSRLDYMLRRGMIDLAGNRTGVAPLSDVRAMLKDREGDFAVYMFARRAKALWEQPIVEQLQEGETVGSKFQEYRDSLRNDQGRIPTDERILEELGSRDPGLSYEDTLAVMGEYADARFEPAAELVDQWYSGVMDYVASASETLASAVRKIQAVDPGSYVPLRRLFKQMEGRARARGSNAARGSVAQRLKGSGRQVLDPIEQLIVQAGSLIETAHERVVLDATIALGDRYDNLGGLVREVPVSQVPGGQISVAEALRVAASKVEREDADAAEMIRGVRDMLGESADDVITLFTQSRQPKQDGEAPILPVVRDGNVRWFQVDPDLHTALSGINPQRMVPFLDATLGAAKRTFTAGTTQLSPSFALFANPMRDLPTFIANSRAGNPARAVAAYFTAMGSAISSSTGINAEQDAWSDLVLKTGVRMAQQHKEDGASTRDLAQRLQNKGLKLQQWTGDAWELLKDALNTPELVPRIAEMKIVADQIGWEPGQRLDMDTTIQLMAAGKEVTVDFGGAGRIGRQINRLVPFFNVGIQSSRAMARAVRRNPLGFTASALMGATMPALALWYLNRDEEWYQDLDDDQKYKHFYIRVGDEIFRVPRAFEVHTIFATIPEILVDSWWREDRAGAESFVERLGRAGGLIGEELEETFVPPILPRVVEAGGEQLANRNFFFDTPIVPRSLEEASPEDQYNEYTTKAARRVGSALGVSPMMFEHWVGAIFGTVGRNALEVSGRDIDALERETGLAGLPIVGRFWVRGGVDGARSQSVEDVYELSKRVRQDQKGRQIRNEDETPEQRQERLWLKDVVSAMSSIGSIAALTTDKEKRADLYRARRELAREALKDHSAGLFRRMRSTVRRLDAQEQRARSLLRTRAQSSSAQR